MDDTNSDAPTEGFEGSNNHVPASYDIDPEDQALADEILGMDPYSDVSGSWQGDVKSIKLKLPTLAALSPEMRAEAEEKLRGVPADQRPAAEADAVYQMLSARRGVARTKAGLGADATDYHREEVEIANEYRSLVAEWNRLATASTEVAAYDPVINPDGSKGFKARYAMSDAQQIAAAARLRDLDYRIGLLVKNDGSHGFEADRRLKKALAESVGKLKEFRSRVEEDAEAKRRADDLLREERINEKAKLYAKHNKRTL